MTYDHDAVADLLGASLPHLVPQAVADEASRLAGCAVAVYLVDLEGSFILRLAGDPQRFPEQFHVEVGVGPEVAFEAVPEVRRRVADLLAGAVVAPLVVRDRVMGFLVCREDPAEDLDAFARQAAPALELASGYTDALHAVRRRKEILPAAEIQQDLLPPRLARVEGADLAGGVLPGYDVGGDFFDYAGNAEGLWLGLGDAAGKGDAAAALSALAVGALRAARRGGAGLDETVHILHEAISGVEGDRFLTGIFGTWDASRRRLRWINCGHPSPLVLRAGGEIEELDGPRTYPLGMTGPERDLVVLSATVAPGDRLVLYSDGVSERRTADGGFIGVSGLSDALGGLRGGSAATVVRGLQDAVLAASSAPLRDDATLLVVVPRELH